jgi:hypothetical protein
MRRAVMLALMMACGFAPRAFAVDLDGYWYVLVHYQDKDSNKPDAWRWDDRVWRFERKGGDKIEWTDYPMVSFQDESGRFERLSGNRAARVVAAWEPNAAQLADIRDGLAATSRGVKTKTIKSTDGTTFTSGEGPGAADAMVISYTETWTIEGLPDKPVFTRSDSMGSAATDSMQGRTQYTTQTAQGDEISGSYNRDGSRVGRFRMIRSAAVGAAGEQDLEERQRKAMRDRAVEMGIVTPAEVQAAIAAQTKLSPDAKSSNRQAARAVIHKNIEDAVRAQGEDPANHAAAIDGLTRKVERLLLDDGKSVEEVQQMFATGQITP